MDPLSCSFISDGKKWKGSELKYAYKWVVLFFFFFLNFLIGDHLVSVLLRAVESSHRSTVVMHLPWFWAEASLALTTLILTQGHLAFILFCFQCFGFGHTSCLSALDLSSCVYLIAVGLWFTLARLHHWDEGGTLLFDTSVNGPPKGVCPWHSQEWQRAIWLNSVKSMTYKAPPVLSKQTEKPSAK